MKIKKAILFIIKLLISTFLFIVILNKISSENSVQIVEGFTFISIAIIFLTGIVQIVLNSLIQRTIMRIYSIVISLKNIVIHNFISTIYYLAIPGFFAPDFYLGYYYIKQKSNYGRIISELFINRVLGLSLFIVFAAIALIIIGSSFFEIFVLRVEQSNVKLILFIGFVTLGFLTVLWFVLKEKRKKIVSKINQIWNETQESKKEVGYAFSLKLLFVFTGLTGRLCIGYILGIEIPILEFACIILILNFLISLPVSLNGIGVREVGYVGLLSIMGVPQSTAFLFALSEFGITLSAALIGVLIFTSMKTNQLIIRQKR